jgi:hypothetical protein
MWCNKGLMVRNQGDDLGNTPEGGVYLSISGRILHKDGSLGGYFSHRRSTRFWYPSEASALEALSALAAQEDREVNEVKHEVNLGFPGGYGCLAWIEARRW